MFSSYVEYRVHRGDGSIVPFPKSGPAYRRVLAQFSHNVDGTYTLTDTHGLTRHSYRTDGKLAQFTDRNGYTTCLSYDAASRLQVPFTWAVGSTLRVPAPTVTSTIAATTHPARITYPALTHLQTGRMRPQPRIRSCCGRSAALRLGAARKEGVADKLGRLPARDTGPGMETAVAVAAHHPVPRHAFDIQPERTAQPARRSASHIIVKRFD